MVSPNVSRQLYCLSDINAVSSHSWTRQDIGDAPVAGLKTFGGVCFQRTKNHKSAAIL